MVTKPLFERGYDIILKSMPEGITTDELIKKMKVKKQSIYTLVHTINNSHPELSRIISRDGKYYIIERDESTELLEIQPRLRTENIKKDITPEINPTKSIPKQLLNTISELSDSDRGDFRDLLKKSIFYGKCSVALLESNQQVNSLMEGLL